MEWDIDKLWNFIDNSKKEHDFQAKIHTDILSNFDKASSDFYGECFAHIKTKQELLESV